MRTTGDLPMRDLGAFLAVARLLPLEQRIAIVKEIVTLLDEPPVSSDDLTLAGWQAAAAQALSDLMQHG